LIVARLSDLAWDAVMPLIVIARFDTLPDAASAAHALVGEGFREEAVSVFRAGGRQAERWPGRLVYAAIARAAALGAAGAAVAAAISAVLTMPDAYSVATVAVGALVGSLLGALLIRFERRSAAEGGLPPQPSFVAVVAGPGEEAKSAQLLRDAGGRGVERLRRYSSAESMGSGRDSVEDSLHTGFPTT
jgi:hypothetical protein